MKLNLDGNMEINNYNSNKNIDTGITSEVFTIKSNLLVLDIINQIIDMKSNAVIKWINSFNRNFIDKNDSVIVVGTYLTGIGIAKLLIKEGFVNITILDIYPHLESFVNSKIPYGIENYNINFSSDLNLLSDAAIVIDTTGFGGLSKEYSAKINSKLFLIEDPVAEDNDILLKNKNNIYDRLVIVDSVHKAVLKTKGLNTKTSGTMTLLVNILNKSLNDINNYEGVLYSTCELSFFEEIIFKEKDIYKFLETIETNAVKVSTINLFDCDKVINNQIEKLDSFIIIV